MDTGLRHTGIAALGGILFGYDHRPRLPGAAARWSMSTRQAVSLPRLASAWRGPPHPLYLVAAATLRSRAA